MGGILIRTMIKQDDDRKGQLWPLRQIISDLGECGIRRVGARVPFERVAERRGECGGSKHKLLV